MGKKHRDREREGTDLIAVKVMREQEWVYEHWLMHMTPQQMRVLVSRPPSEGGLGYDLSIQAIEGLRKGYLERNGYNELSRAEARVKRAHDLAIVQQLALAGMRKAAKVGAVDVHSTKLYLEASRDVAKHYGTDEPVKIEADVTTHDAVADELNAMLARAGKAPIEVPHE